MEKYTILLLIIIILFLLRLYFKEGFTIDLNLCSICQKNTGEPIISICSADPSHKAHRHCIDDYIRNKIEKGVDSLCPVCNAPIKDELIQPILSVIHISSEPVSIHKQEVLHNIIAPKIQLPIQLSMPVEKVEEVELIYS